ncbi:MAG: ATP-binding cassette domain-containing protein [Dehalococcoidales bacterium]|jgi:iron complex transport system ATP-binding protein|nr:ATP-binding cassette domain-containing protein [Dehalococcoidales bacterium]
MRKKKSLPPPTNRTPPTGSSDRRPSLLEYRGVTVSQNNRVVLHDITFTINLGEHVAILGPNGAGKSFLIRTITRECYPHSGIPGSYVRILGKDMWNVSQLRTMLGIVNSNLVTGCTGGFSGRQIMLSGFFSSIGIWPHHKVTPVMERKVNKVMALLEISHLAERKMNAISTGELRRILIGRALVHDPRALVLDEPSINLDFHAASELRRVMRKIADTGKNIIIVTHNLPDIIPEITRVILLKDGRVFEDGPKETILTSSSLSRLFGTSLEVVKRDRYYHLW